VRTSRRPTQGHRVVQGRSFRLTTSGRAAAIAAIVASSILAPSAADAGPAAQPAVVTHTVGHLPVDSPVTLARLEARAAKLVRQYRGQLASLTDAASAATAATDRALLLGRQLGNAQRQIGRLAAASYMGGGRKKNKFK